MTSKAIEVNYFEAATELCISVEPLKPLTISLFTQNWLVHPVCQICTPILGSSYCLKNTQMSRLNA